MKQSLLLASAILLFVAPIANAEETSFPEVCKSDMAMDISADHSKMMTGMTTEEHQKAGMTGMMQMNKDMMQGMMHKDPDVAFVCGMIAHHMGAIDMSKVEQKFGKNAWAKEMAQKVIDAQTREIADMTEWLKTNAK
ncbi:hypothetical protein AX761_23090 [Rhizobium sp. 58]|nr:hypothetical protein AX761_23090 [Rhizobium sp. 58]